MSGNRERGKEIDAINKMCCIYVLRLFKQHSGTTFKYLHNNKEQIKRIMNIGNLKHIPRLYKNARIGCWVLMRGEQYMLPVTV